MKNLTLAEQTVWKFIQAGLYSAISTAGVVTYFTGVQTWEQFQTASNAAALSLLIGFVSGILMALHKYYVTGATAPVASTMPEALVE